MYNPDAIAEWIYEKYPQLFAKVKEQTDIEIPFSTVMFTKGSDFLLSEAFNVA